MLITTAQLLLLFGMLGFLYRLKLKNYRLGLRILFGLGLGVLYGFLLPFSPANGLFVVIENILRFLGSGYLALLKMLVIPLVLTAIIHSILNLGANNNGSAIKRLSFFTLVMLLGMTAIASLIGIAVAKWFAVGEGMTLAGLVAEPKHVHISFTDTLLGFLPANPISAMVNQNMVAVVIFAALIGIAARILDSAEHDKLEVFRQLMGTLFSVVKKLVIIVLGLTPYGVLGLIALMIVQQGTALLSGMLVFVGAMYVAMALVFMMHLFIASLTGQKPLLYLKKAASALFVAFTTRSSFGTLPVTEETLRDRFKTTQVTATFVPSVGATVGMNACAGVFPAMLVVMTLAMMGQPLTFTMILMIMGINIVASLGITGIPGTAYIAATVTLTSLNLPYAVVALVQSVDPVVDMGRTATNVNGVMTTALVVDRFSKEKGQEISMDDLNIELPQDDVCRL
jgi:L-cystine uptake protein TcyP (sodium:dicarboxylate symporter family)